MNIEAAKQFVLENARPVDLAVYQYFFENGSREKVVEELAKYQNKDGGFGHGLEADYWNPNSSPIATNDAIITLYHVGALDPKSDMMKGIVRYLASHDSFDEDKKRWLFAIDTNKDYPHAIWWEKKEDGGINGFNPTMSLAAFMVCFGEQNDLYKELIREGVAYLKEDNEMSGDSLKCYLLAYELLKNHKIFDIVNLLELKELLCEKIEEIICKDIEKYGVEYVTAPSDFFPRLYLDFITPKVKELIDIEKGILGKNQKEDGSFDITWQWYTPYTEFAQARDYWRPRITIDKLLFVSEH